MSSSTPRWLLISLLVVGGALASWASQGPSAFGQESPGAPEGEALFRRSCATCHGIDGRGRDGVPALTDVGAAAVDFQLRTGRMPMADTDVQTVRKPPAFSSEQIAALVDYVAGFGDGPAIPEVRTAGRDLSNGHSLFVANCAACHGGTGNGGAAGERALAPSLARSEPLDIAEAMITGPGEMPVFDLSDDDRDDVVAYVRYLMTEQPGAGADVGGVGPVPEGFVGWGLGVLVLTGICYLLGSKAVPRSARRKGGPGSGEIQGS